MKFNRSRDDFIRDLLELILKFKSDFFIVEGKQDVEALSKLGILNVLPLNGKGYYEFVEYASQRANKFILLTDFDPEGEKIAKKLRKAFQNAGIKTNNKARNNLRKLFKRSKITTIQGLRNLELSDYLL